MFSRLLILLAFQTGLACSNAPGPAPVATNASARRSSTEDPRPVGDVTWKSNAANYLDQRVELWLSDPPSVANVKCAMSCHTTFPAVLAHASLPAERTVNIARARARFEARLPSAPGTATAFYGRDNNRKVQESHATESVLAATAFVLDDLARGEQIGVPAKEALERMWSQQGPDGAWPWLDFGLEPWEHDDAFGVAMAALATGRIPAHTTPGQAEGVGRLREYVRTNVEGMSLHDQTALLWSSSSLGGLLSSSQAKSIATALRNTQRPDGGFAIGRLMPGHTSASSSGDGYATALATLALCTTCLL
ncbi:MAG: hypothetical protein KUG77_24370, partial [Nannocystaceae bacterium]|nr:hypothetical protein [Nannocystaceae bacterium]